MDDVLGGLSSGRGGDLQRAMEIIGGEETGIVVLLRGPNMGSLTIKTDDPVSLDSKKVDVKRSPLRDYGVGAQILLDLGVSDMILLSNTKRAVVGLDGYGLRIVGHKPIIK